MDRRANAEITDALDIDARALILGVEAILPVLNRYLAETNTNRAYVATQDVAAIQRFSRPHGVIETLKIDCENGSNGRARKEI